MLDTTGRPGKRFFFRNWFARTLGVRPERKAEIYLSLAQSATLRDTAYWIEIIFACGIATLGLVLSSPAVIIGAMLISPLMGPILAGGLALAAGDLVLGIRSLLTLLISTVVAILFATLLVAIIPFKEMTPEIASRTQPNTLDLVIALFSGAVGSVAISKKVRGVATSIPGVAIAVALLPPLCVVGYGVGYALSINGAEGMAVARGGGLLFLTNLIAIVFMSMIVFLALNIDISLVRDAVSKWKEEDVETQLIERVLARVPLSERLRLMGTLPSRFLLIGSIILVLAIPLGQAFGDLRSEIQRKQTENRVQRAATRAWQENFARFDDGSVRSYVDTMAVRVDEGSYGVNLRVITSEPYEPRDREAYEGMIAAALGVANRDVSVEMVEIPLSAAALRERLEEDKIVQNPGPSAQALPPSFRELQTTLAYRFDASMEGFVLPGGASVIESRFSISGSEARVVVTYLAEQPLSADAEELIARELRRRLVLPEATVQLDWLDPAGEIPYGWNSVALSDDDLRVLDRFTRALRLHPELRLDLIVHRDTREQDRIIEARMSALMEVLGNAVERDRVDARVGGTGERRARLVLRAR